MISTTVALIIRITSFAVYNFIVNVHVLSLYFERDLIFGQTCILIYLYIVVVYSAGRSTNFIGGTQIRRIPFNLAFSVICYL